MSTEKIAIISKDKRLASLIEAELLLLGISTEHFDKVSNLNDEFKGYIFDFAEGMNIIKSNASIKIIITEQEPSEDIFREATRILKYPFRLSELRNIFISSSHNDPSLQKEQKPVIFANKKELTVTLGERKIKLSRCEFAILELLCSEAGKCVPRETLSKALGNWDSNMTEVYICHLRKKLEADGESKIIHTVRQKGYMTHYKIK